MYANESQENRSEGNEKAQVFAHRLLNIGDPQEDDCRIQID